MIGKPGFRLIAHTADIGLEMWAATRAELFLAAAHGLTSLQFWTSPVVPVLRRAVVLEAGDPAELLVAWLNEILFFGEALHAVPAEFTIEELTACRLSAVIAGEPFDPSRHAVERSAKAVTYHQLVVEERDGGWYGRVYIDL